jgi:hypothetical protein
VSDPILIYSMIGGLCVGAAAGAALGWVVTLPVVVLALVLGAVAERARD